MVVDVAEFYGTALGAVAARLLRQRLALMWPVATGMAVLGVGFAGPYLRLWRQGEPDHDAGRVVAMVPTQLGAMRWPPAGGGLACSAEEAAWPFADMSFDRVLLVHALEAAETARGVLREAWRVLKDDGRLLVVAPNRSGVWAHRDSTPFGQGQPFSAAQIDRLLTSTLFRVERRDTALYVPPSRRRLVLRGAEVWERAGRRWLPGLAGVTLTEASKDLYAGVPLRRQAARRLVLAEAAG